VDTNCEMYTGISPIKREKKTAVPVINVNRTGTDMLKEQPHSFLTFLVDFAVQQLFIVPGLKSNTDIDN